MKTKKILLAGATALLLGLSGVSTNVSAHSFSWWCKPREVKVIKPVRINKVKVGNPRAYNHVVAHKTLKKGTKLKIQHVASYTWIIHKKGLADGYFKSPKTKAGKYFWETGNYPKKWYKLVK